MAESERISRRARMRQLGGGTDRMARKRSVQHWPLSVPARLGLIRPTERQHSRVLADGPNQLQPDWQALTVEAARRRESRRARGIERQGVAKNQFAVDRPVD